MIKTSVSAFRVMSTCPVRSDHPASTTGVPGHPLLGIEVDTFRLQAGSLQRSRTAGQLVGGKGPVPVYHPPPREVRPRVQPVENPSDPPGCPGLTRHGGHGAVARDLPRGNSSHGSEDGFLEGRHGSTVCLAGAPVYLQLITYRIPVHTGATVARTLNLLFTLALLFGVVYLSVMVNPSDAPEDRLTVLMGFVLLASSVAGSLARTVGLPKITGFLVVGILAGPSISGLIPWGALDELRLIDRFALALIALLAGGELKVRALRPAAKSIAFTTLAVVGVVWVGMTLVFLPIGFFLPFLDGVGFLGILALGALLGIWAANSSPDLTVAVIEETGAKGPLTDVILGVTIVKDVVVIVLFTLTLTLVRPLLGDTGGTEGMLLGLALGSGWGPRVGWRILGWVFSLYLEQEGLQPAYATFLFSYLLVVVSDLLHVELLLAGVAAGFTIENMSEAGDEMIHSIEKVAVDHFRLLLHHRRSQSGPGSYWVVFGSRPWSSFSPGSPSPTGAPGWGPGGPELPPEIQELTWRGLMSQGGVTLGLLLLLQEAFPEIGEGVVALGMAVIIGNILGGPILLKTALARPRAGSDGQIHRRTGAVSRNIFHAHAESDVADQGPVHDHFHGSLRDREVQRSRMGWVLGITAGVHGGGGGGRGALQLPGPPCRCRPHVHRRGGPGPLPGGHAPGPAAAQPHQDLRLRATGDPGGPDQRGGAPLHLRLHPEGGVGTVPLPARRGRPPHAGGGGGGSGGEHRRGPAPSPSCRREPERPRSVPSRLWGIFWGRSGPSRRES